VSKGIYIIIAEPSAIVFEGLTGVLLKSGLKCNISIVTNLDELQQQFIKHSCDVVIINPSLVQNNLKNYNAIRCEYIDTQWISLIYAFYNPQILSLFNSTINILDLPDVIANTIQNILEGNKSNSAQASYVLSDREIDVLKQLAAGMANKEIADRLNISINTVITHRKNISQKTGIKSVSGLTIYAVVKKLITLENITD
jgi:DNA-binding NarL/FixJ family response regulator